MISINEILKPDFDWEKLKIDDEQFDELCADLIIDFLKKNTPKENSTKLTFFLNVKHSLKKG